MAQRVWFQTPTGPVQAELPPGDLYDGFRAQAPDWPIDADGPVDAPVMDIRTEDDGGFRFLSPHYDAPDFVFPPGLMAGNGLIGCLIHTFVARTPDWICLHAGAVAMDGGLTVLLGDTLAGKSTLSVALMAEGCRLWTDDRLPIRGDLKFEGLALALRPKLRRPLPPNTPDEFRDFVDQRRGADEGDMHYVVGQAGEAAGFGQALAVRRLVVLNRAHNAALEIRPAALGETVKRLVTTCFAPHLGTMGLLERARALAESAECLSLDYADSFDAARALTTWRPS